MVKKIIFCFIFFVVIAVTAAEVMGEVTIISVRGDVLVRPRAITPWHSAVVGEALTQDSEVLTKTHSQCSLSFDVNVENVVTVDENSQITIADAFGRNIGLSKGRVFSLIGKKPKEESFEIKTPTAIAGARGTGWSVDFFNSTVAKCFQGVMFVIGLDKQGNKTSEQDVEEGSGMEVFEGGAFGETFELTGEDKNSWDAFVNNLNDMKGASDTDQEGPLDLFDNDVRNEQKDGLQEDETRQLRQETESQGDQEIQIDE